jgi:hypothetical protein
MPPSWRGGKHHLAVDHQWAKPCQVPRTRGRLVAFLRDGQVHHDITLDTRQDMGQHVVIETAEELET